MIAAVQCTELPDGGIDQKEASRVIDMKHASNEENI